MQASVAYKGHAENWVQKAYDDDDDFCQHLLSSKFAKNKLSNISCASQTNKVTQFAAAKEQKSCLFPHAYF